MLNSRSYRRTLFSTWSPVVAAVLVVMIESTPWLGSDQTSPFLRATWERIFHPVSSAQWDLINTMIRKTGHVVVFGCVGLSFERAWLITLRRAKFLTTAILAIFSSTLLAAIDEWHQSHLSNRTGTFTDVVLDGASAALFVFAAYMIPLMFKLKSTDEKKSQ